MPLDQTAPSAHPVLLPVTEFRAKPTPSTEDAQVARWQDQNLAARVASGCAGHEPFVLHSGPPYANGHLHMGHALNFMLKDALVRAHRMSGRNATLVPGWDCHGLPIEWKVEEDLRAKGVAKADLSPLEFRALCRTHAAGWVECQTDELRRMGVLAEWDHRYLTMSPEADGATVRRLQELLLQGKLYPSLRPVLWSVPERTALADAEVEHQEVRHTSLLVRFPMADDVAPELQGASMVCWTTTPWSLPGNRAVACNPDVAYAVCRVDAVTEGSLLKTGERLVMAAAAVERTLPRAGATSWEVLSEHQGDSLQSSACRHPLHGLGYGHAVPVLAAEWVDVDTGTGLVHVAPGLGPDDHKLGLQHGLVVPQTLGEDGRYLPDVPAFAGMVVMGDDGQWGPADVAVLAALGDAGMVVSTWTAKHKAAFSWRSKAPLVYRATPQWFVSMDGLRDEAVAALDDVTFHPEASRARLTSMLSGRPDWCVSRQRSWGVPLGLFTHRDTGKVLMDRDVLDRVHETFCSEGSDAWYSRPASFFLGEGYDPAEWDQVMDVLDVWFESGATWSWVLPSRHKVMLADLYLEGSDQHRGWFQASLLEATELMGVTPFRSLLTHGFVLDAKGRKMSKSLGNVVDPLDVASRYGADALRLWALVSDSTGDVRYAEPAMKSHAETLRRWRNCLRFAVGNLAAASYEPVAFEDLEEPERWVLARLRQMGTALRADLKALDMPGMVRRLSAFCAEDLSSFWFDMRKDSLYCDAPSSLTRRGVATVLDLVFAHLCSWMAPLAPFAAEEAWQARFGDTRGSVHDLSWPAAEGLQDGDKLVLERWEHVREVRSTVLAAAEPQQKAGTLRALVEACVAVHTPHAEELANVDLAMVCGTSVVSLAAADKLCVDVGQAPGERCERCWKVLPEVTGRGLCLRCEAV